jgi:hypothetical protein
VPPDITEGEPVCEDDDISECEEYNGEEDEDDLDLTMDEEGIIHLILQLKWKFASIDSSAEVTVLDEHMRRFYDGPEGLCPGLAESFKDPFQCFQEVGGLDYELVAQLAAGSNDYFHRFKMPLLDHNQLWHGIRVCPSSG